jgi:hypothetical protein
MGIKCTNEDIIAEYFSKVLEIVHHEVLRSLSYLGEKCVTRVRDRSKEESWIDQTGNLRSSIGYAVLEYGREYIRSTFKQVMKGSEGVTQGNRMIDELAKRYADTYVLVVVAGMSYAEYVEARDSKDVLASTELWARQEINGVMQKTKERIERRIRSEIRH